MIYQAIVDRILEFYDPFAGLGLTKLECENIDDPIIDCSVSAAGEHIGWSAAVHRGRIRYFVKRPEKINPIELDNQFRHESFTGLVVVDGHHRLIAAHMMGMGTIPCIYGGLVDLLEYLTGDKDNFRLHR